MVNKGGKASPLGGGKKRIVKKIGRDQEDGRTNWILAVKSGEKKKRLRKSWAIL